MDLNDIKKLIAAILICQLAGIVGSMFTFSTITTWYVTLNKSQLSPPNWIFGPVWTILYTLMGVSLYLIYKKYERARANAKGQIKNAINIFAVQLMLNMLWSVLFFGLRSPILGFVCIIVLLISIIWTIKKFYPVSKEGALILLPYLIWVTFATYLNYSIVLLN